MLEVPIVNRNPNELADYCNQLKQRKVEVIIAGAGMATRLPGTIAAYMEYHIPNSRSGLTLGGIFPCFRCLTFHNQNTDRMSGPIC